MLATNMIRKDLNSQNQYDAGVALSGLSCFISADLSRDLANDIMTLVSVRLLIGEPKVLLVTMNQTFVEFEKIRDEETHTVCG